MNDIFGRVWENLNARLTGPLHFRFIIQPTVATILAIRAGLRMPVGIGRPSFGQSSGIRPTGANC
jgi:hypothetical protein